MKYSFIEFGRNVKIEIITVIMYSLAYIVNRNISNKFWNDRNLLLYFTSDRLNGIAAFFAITVGVYIAVVTVLATSRIGISKEMLKRNLDSPLINVIIAGIVEDMTAVGLSIFIPLNTKSVHILIAFLIVAIESFAKFIFLLIAIFKANMSEMAREIDEEEKYNDELLYCLNEILRQLKH